MRSNLSPSQEMKAINLLLFLFSLTVSLTSCENTNQKQVQTTTETKRIELTIKDIRGKNITYDFYQVKGKDELEYLSTEVADKDGNTIVALDVNQNINNIIVKRTKNGVEKRQIVPIRSKKLVVQFLL